MIALITHVSTPMALWLMFIAFAQGVVLTCAAFATSIYLRHRREHRCVQAQFDQWRRARHTGGDATQ